MSMDTIHRFVTLTQRKRRIEALLRQTKAALAETEIAALNYIADGGAKAIKVNAGTVYHNMTIRARLNPAHIDEAHEELRKRGLGDMIKPTVHAGTLSAWVKEQGGVPHELRNLIGSYEDHRLGFRTAS